MKKILLFTLLIPSFLFAGEWTKDVVLPDELLGVTNSYTKYTYIDGGNTFVFRSDIPDQFYITSPYVLDCQTYGGSRICLKVRIGLYDGEGRMIEKFEMYLEEKNNQCTAVGTFDCDFMSQPVGQRKNTRKILSHLKRSDGFVRIIADSYSHGLYDLRVGTLSQE